MKTDEGRICQCGAPEWWIADPHIPVEFDERMNEYGIVRDGSWTVMRYCFWCGGKLPESKRGDFFTTPSEAELAEVRALLKGCKSHEDVARVLGPPDDVVDMGGQQARKATEPLFARWKQHYRYTTRWESLQVYVPVMIEGGFCYMVRGHYLPNNTDINPLGTDARHGDD